MTDRARTPLDGLHRRLGGRMVPFAGWEMPLNYGPGILREHLHTRERASLFDVSHMGQLRLSAPGGVAEAVLGLERCVAADLAGLAEGRQRYGLLTGESGGILDDLMVARCGGHLLLVVNAARTEHDLAHLGAGLPAACRLERLDRGLLALQGPEAEAVLAALAPAAAAMRFMDVAEMTLEGAECVVTRSGYTGEDGYEISVPADAAERLAEALLGDPRVAPAGLGARDTLRLEAGLCLWGQDIDETTTPAEAGLGWAIGAARRAGGAREGGFPGAERILCELETGPPRRRVGLAVEGRAPLRAGAPLLDADGAAVGRVTSGAHSPSLGRPVAMGYVPAALAEPGTALRSELRGSAVELSVVPLPFVPPRQKRA